MSLIIISYSSNNNNNNNNNNKPHPKKNVRKKHVRARTQKKTSSFNYLNIQVHYIVKHFYLIIYIHAHIYNMHDHTCLKTDVYIYMCAYNPEK